MGDDFDDVEAMLEAPFRKDIDFEVRGTSFWAGFFCWFVLL